MKKTILWGALFTLIGTQVHAEQTQPVTTAPTPLSAPQEQTAPTPTPIINCDYKIPAQIKKPEQPVILAWSEKAVIQAFSFDPNNLDAQMQKLQACFTEQGWTGFNSALEKSGNLEAIKSQKLTVKSQIDGQILINEEKDNQWKLTLPLVVTYQSDKEKISQSLSIDLTVGRKPTGDLGITQMIAVPRNTAAPIKPKEAPPTPQDTNLNAPTN